MPALILDLVTRGRLLHFDIIDTEGCARKHAHIGHERRFVTSARAVVLANIAVYTTLGDVRSAGLRGAALMIDSDRTTHALRICAGQGSPHVAVAKARAQRPRLSVEIGTGRLLLMIAPEPCVVRHPKICEGYLTTVLYRTTARQEPQASR